MNRFYLEIHGKGYRLPIGDPRGYETLEEAKREAMHHVEVIGPHDRIYITNPIAYAYLGGDGSYHISENPSG